MAFFTTNEEVAALNFIALNFSILVVGILLNSDTVCAKALQTPIITLGVFLILVSLIGIFGFFFRVKCLLWLYLAVKFLLIVLMFSFVVFTFVVTNKGAEYGPGFKDQYKLGDYSSWLQKRVASNENWAEIRACLVRNRACESLQEINGSYSLFHDNNLYLDQSGCCKPPKECNFEFVSPTVWTKNTTVATSTNPDCMTWNNDASSLCYDCQSCKAVMAASLKTSLNIRAGILIIFLVFIMIVYSLGCRALRNNGWGPQSKGGRYL